jgi:hypothetical protein
MSSIEQQQPILFGIVVSLFNREGVIKVYAETCKSQIITL